MNIYALKVGDVVFLKKSVTAKYKFNPQFIKKGQRPFVVAKITEYNAFWVVPSYSNCSDYSDITQKYYQIVTTPNGDIKYLKFRDTIVISKEDIHRTNQANGLIYLSDSERKEFARRFRSICIKFKNNRTYFEEKFYQPFIYEKQIISHYLESPYRWLERDFNKVDPKRNFSMSHELNKSDYAETLYYYYLQNLKFFLVSRNNYIPVRKEQCISYFNQTKSEIQYKCYTDQGYIKSVNPLAYTDNFNDAKPFQLIDLNNFNFDYIDEQVKVTVPLLNHKQEMENASEIIWLNNNIVSKKTYYDVYKSEPTKEEIREIVRNYKNLDISQSEQKEKDVN